MNITKHYHCSQCFVNITKHYHFEVGGQKDVALSVPVSWDHSVSLEISGLMCSFSSAETDERNCSKDRGK